MMWRPVPASPNSALARLEASAALARKELASYYDEVALAAVAAALTLPHEPAPRSEIADEGHIPALLRNNDKAA